MSCGDCAKAYDEGYGAALSTKYLIPNRCTHCNGTGMEPDFRLVGANMKAKRLAVGGISLRDVAREMGLSASYVSDLEHGKRNWSAELITRYNRALDFDR